MAYPDIIELRLVIGKKVGFRHITSYLSSVSVMIGGLSFRPVKPPVLNGLLFDSE